VVINANRIYVILLYIWWFKGKIMKLGNTFVTIGSPKFLEVIFRPKKCC
jgi:hypothetical protein